MPYLNAFAIFHTKQLVSKSVCNTTFSELTPLHDHFPLNLLYDLMNKFLEDHL